MPDHDPISRLLETLSGDLSQAKLESLCREFDTAAQDRRETLVFFVLANVCQRLASALEGEGVSLERFQELTENISEQMADILHHVQRSESALAGLEQLVSTLYRNLGLYRQ